MRDLSSLVCSALAQLAVCVATMWGAPPSVRASESDPQPASVSTPRTAPVQLGAYYFDGWSGRHPAAEDPMKPWARNAPTHLTQRLVQEFPEREPIWGWRADDLAIMERQIDLAADHGLTYFAFCWYWHDNKKAVNLQAIQEDPKHTGLRLFLEARNNHRMKFCLTVAAHQGFEIIGSENWKQAADFWLPYLKHPQYLTVGGKPLLIVLHSRGDAEGLSSLQNRAREAGLPGVAVASTNRATVEMGFTHATHYNIVPGYGRPSEPHKYAELGEAARRFRRGEPEQPYIPTVTSGWDRRPWEGPRGFPTIESWYYPDRTPEQFAGSLQEAIDWMDQHPHETTAERLIMICAWNEFGEGSYIAPTKGDPQGEYLKAMKAVVNAATRRDPFP